MFTISFFQFFSLSVSGYLTTQSHFIHFFLLENNNSSPILSLKLLNIYLLHIAQTTFYTDVWCVRAEISSSSSSSSLLICLMQCMHLSFGSVMRHKSANALCSLLVVALNFIWVCVSECVYALGFHHFSLSPSLTFVYQCFIASVSNYYLHVFTFWYFWRFFLPFFFFAFSSLEYNITLDIIILIAFYAWKCLSVQTIYYTFELNATTHNYLFK